MDTTGFNGRAWIDTSSGHPRTEVARVTERFTRRDFGQLEIDIAIDEPKAWVKAGCAEVARARVMSE